MATPAPPPHALEVTPESALQFVLTRDGPSGSGSGGGGSADPTAKCTMTLRHTGKTGESIAFKVKTTQPRRYLVRPNQGVVGPGGTESVSILLVERDKQILLHSYDRLGQSALDHSKDKFLVQCCAVDDAFASKYADEKAKAGPSTGDGKISGLSKEMTDQLTAMWNAASGSGQSIYNKKLHVRHVVPSSDGGAAASPVAAASTSASPPVALAASDKTPTESMTPEQMFAEITNLRRKYDELVSFSVNLTAERDILNNTLEQTKRDLNREMAARAALENAGGGGGGSKSAGGKKGGMGLMMVLIIAVMAALAGIKLANSDAVEFLGEVPVVGDLLGFDDDEAEEPAVVAASKEEL